MRQWTAVILGLCLGTPLEAAETAVDARPFAGAEFIEILASRQVELSSDQAAALRRFLADTKPNHSEKLAGKLTGAATISVMEVLSRIVNKDGCQPVLASLREHPDVLLRFVSNCGLAGSGESDAANVVHDMLHDESLSALDQRLIRTWADGAGLDPSQDDPQSILKHLMNLMGKGQKFKAGDACPDFLATTDSGVKLDFGGLKGKTIVLHFWSSSCKPCLVQMPAHIDALSKLPGEETVVLFVSLDEEPARFRKSVEKYAMPFHNICDGSGWGGPLARTFGVKQLPFDVVVGPDGKIFSNSIEELPLGTN